MLIFIDTFIWKIAKREKYEKWRDINLFIFKGNECSEKEK